MSKLKALTLTILFAVQAVTFYLTHNTPFMVIAIVGTLLFLSVWTAKHHRDRNIEKQARLERTKTAQASQCLPPMTTKGSHRLFVPPSLED